MSTQSKPEGLPHLQSPRLTLRPVVEDDLLRLMEILREPEVSRRWGTTDPEECRELLLGEGADGAERISTFTVVQDERTIGWIAGWENLSPEYRHAGIDLFLSTEQHGKGLGPEAIARVCRFLFETQGHHRITIDPAADNLRAIRAYEKVGFRRVGVLRRYERGADGTFHDGLLLDLLAGELLVEIKPSAR